MMPAVEEVDVLWNTLDQLRRQKNWEIEGKYLLLKVLLTREQARERAVWEEVIKQLGDMSLIEFDHWCREQAAKVQP